MANKKRDQVDGDYRPPDENKEKTRKQARNTTNPSPGAAHPVGRPAEKPKYKFNERDHEALKKAIAVHGNGYAAIFP